MLLGQGWVQYPAQTADFSVRSEQLCCWAWGRCSLLHSLAVLRPAASGCEASSACCNCSSVL